MTPDNTKLTTAQTEKLKTWVAEGKNLSQIQAALEADGVRMTYMALRFLVDDLGLTIKETEKQKTVPPMPAAPQKAAGSNDSMSAEDDESFDDATGMMGEEAASENPETVGTGSVSVTIDPIVRPGAVVSGGVVFGDGTAVQWSLDQMGRLGLVGAPKGYQPSVTDIEEFQRQLRGLLEARGGI